MSQCGEMKDVRGLQNRKTGRKNRNKRDLRNLLAVLFLILLPPVGVVMLWRTRWSGTVKYCLTGAVVAVLAIAVALLPSAENKVVGGIEMVGTDRDVEVYGPGLPTAMVTGYTISLATDSIFAEEVETDTHYVYAAKTGSCYHEYECKFAYASSQKLTVYEAHYLGYEPCGRCNPPEYVPGA